jgi:hypothetical protein
MGNSANNGCRVGYLAGQMQRFPRWECNHTTKRERIPSKNRILYCQKLMNEDELNCLACWWNKTGLCRNKAPQRLNVMKDWIQRLDHHLQLNGREY